MTLEYCQWVPIALFISEAVRATGSLFLSYAGGDKACLVGTTPSDSACLLCSTASQPSSRWQRGNLQLTVSMKECLSGQRNLIITGFMLLVFMTTHPFQ